MSILDKIRNEYVERKVEEMSFQEYLELCKTDSSAYATPAERLLKVIGPPTYIDTSKDDRLGRIFQNRTIKTYEPFKEFYGMEEVIEQVVNYFKHNAQNLEESKQILYFLGPVGGGKSTLAEKIKALMEKTPFYTIMCGDEISPVFETPLGLFNPEEHGELLEEEFGIPRRYLKGICSPWATKRLDTVLEGDISKFKVVKMWPSKARQIGVCKTEPSDENNQDISDLVGKVDIRKLSKYSQNDPDCYSFSGALCRGNQGVVEFVEMFKAPIKTLNPLLTATQEGNYKGTESIPAIPFTGIILAHSNEAEWQTFRNNKNNEAFIDRICVIKVPYCLRVTEEQKIYEKLIRGSELVNAVCAPKTMECLAQMSVLSRLVEPGNTTIYNKMRVYNGENIKEISSSVPSYQDFREEAGVNEGMNGLSSRFAYKVLSTTFNYDKEEISANPVHLFAVLEKRIKQEQFGKEREAAYLNFLEEYIKPEYKRFIGNQIQEAYLESYSSFGQNMFDRYITFADHWVEDKDYKDYDTGEMYDRETLNAELEKIEKPANIANPKDFRNEVVKYALRYRAKNNNQNPAWNSYAKLRDVIRAKLFTQTDDLLPVISFGVQKTEDDKSKHEGFLNRMVELGYTEKQVRLIVEWWLRHSKN